MQDFFSNDDKLSEQIYNAGEKVEEKVWRMPLHKNYDKLMNSKNADVQNINYVGGAGSTTAAQFLQRFILNKTPWGTSRYCWHGFFKIWRSFKLRRCNRIWSKIIKSTC